MKTVGGQKLRVLVASNGSEDTAQAYPLIMRLAKNPNIETRAIVDDEESPLILPLQHGTSVLQNIYFGRHKGMSGISRSEELARAELSKKQAYELCKWADLMVLAPIDADTLTKMLHGFIDCLLLEILRGWDVSKSILLVPGMTTLMWENPLTQKQFRKVRQKWQWIQIMSPILWQYSGVEPVKRILEWDGFSDLVDTIENQADLMTLDHGNESTVLKTSALLQEKKKSNVTLPMEIWTLIFEQVGDWEISRALNIYANIPTPIEWQCRTTVSDPRLDNYMRSLERVILTSSTQKIITKLQEAPENLKSLSNICVNLIIKFCLLNLLTYLENNHKDLFRASFGRKILPTKASAVYGRTEVLDWWLNSPFITSKDYTTEAVDGASKMGFIHVLDWWRHSGLPMKYTEAAMEQASSKGHMAVLEWWKQCSIHQGSFPLELEMTPRRLSSTEVLSRYSEIQPPLPLLPGKSLLTAAQNNQALILRWWDHSRIPVGHSESVAKVASQHGHVEALETWRELKGEKMAFDSKILVDPTKNGHLDVLQWWKNFSRGTDERPGRKVEYKTCDIEEALEDCVRNETISVKVREWWAQNGLNLGLQVREWTRVRVL
ncbi:hypothetical protein K3495_g11962 [Podosphaera aphanis]|nr:hypothetical protein K3495_g11962 [Podosphaera aphanis]